MVTHLFDSMKEYNTLCNTKTKSKSSHNKNEVTCKKCNYILESERLLSLYRKNEGTIIAEDIRASKRLF